VREHQDLVFISQLGMVQRTGVRGISQQGRPAQGVRVMNLRDGGDRVSAVALVMEDEADTSAVVAGEVEGVERIDELPAEVIGETPPEPIGGSQDEDADEFPPEPAESGDDAGP
jgi:DNA gyrase subunit A